MYQNQPVQSAFPQGQYGNRMERRGAFQQGGMQGPVPGQPGYAQPGYAQPGYAQPAYAPQPGFAPQQAYNPQLGYNPQQVPGMQPMAPTPYTPTLATPMPASPILTAGTSSSTFLTSSAPTSSAVTNLTTLASNLWNGLVGMVKSLWSAIAKATGMSQ